MPKILIADDNTNIQRMVALAFEERGIQVVAVGNGEAAVRRLVDLNPDLVLADIFMPVRSGYEVCEYIKKDQRFSHIPVILLVGAFDPLDEKEARRVGADGVLKKPFVPPDPLIAMVTSVLEKNPRVAAELAKAKEVIPEPPPLPEIEIAAKLEPKPLPEFPEPSPEEAALVYGFGSGRRSVLEDAKDLEPVEPFDAEAESDEDSEDADTSHDWRRAAMDFEVPEEVGGRPAFDDEAAFPSEHDVPPRHIVVKDSDEGLEPVVAGRAFEFAPDPADAPKAAPEPLAAEHSAPAFAAVEETPAVVAREWQAPTPEIRAEPEIQPEPVLVDSVSTSHVPHWMDALSAVPSVGGWMAGLFKKKEEPKQSEEAAAPLALREVPGALVVSAPVVSAPLSDEPLASEPPVSEHPFSEHSNGEHDHFAEVAGVAPENAPVNANEAPVPFFHPSPRPNSFSSEPANDSWFAPAPAAFDASPQAAPEVADAPVNLTPDLMPQPESADASHKDPYLVEHAAVRVTPEALLETEATDIPASVSQRDPYLDESPGVHVTPEPLLDAEDPQPEAQVSSRMEEIAAAHSMLAPAPEYPAPSYPLGEQGAEPQDELHEDLHHDLHGDVNADSNGDLHEEPPVPVESFAEEFSERIPTAPPPNREALAGIPFLTPPPDFHPDARDEAEVSAETVDAVVQRVLERLEPQLHELLSQSVLKPLVESMLNGELAKKNR